MTDRQSPGCTTYTLVPGANPERYWGSAWPGPAPAGALKATSWTTTPGWGRCRPRTRSLTGAGGPAERASRASAAGRLPARGETPVPVRTAGCASVVSGPPAGAAEAPVVDRADMSIEAAAAPSRTRRSGRTVSRVTLRLSQVDRERL